MVKSGAQGLGVLCRLRDVKSQGESHDCSGECCPYVETTQKGTLTKVSLWSEKHEVSSGAGKNVTGIHFPLRRENKTSAESPVITCVLFPQHFSYEMPVVGMEMCRCCT